MEWSTFKCFFPSRQQLLLHNAASSSTGWKVKANVAADGCCLCWKTAVKRKSSGAFFFFCKRKKSPESAKKMKIKVFLEHHVQVAGRLIVVDVWRKTATSSGKMKGTNFQESIGTIKNNQETSEIIRNHHKELQRTIENNQEAAGTIRIHQNCQEKLPRTTRKHEEPTETNWNYQNYLEPLETARTCHHEPARTTRKYQEPSRLVNLHYCLFHPHFVNHFYPSATLAIASC